MFKNQREDYRILYNIILGLTVLTLIVIVTLLTQRIQRDTQNEVVVALELEHDLSVFFANIQDLELGQRGYLLTLDSSYLEKYEFALSKVKSSLEDVNIRLKLTKIAPSRIDNLSKMVDQKIEELERSILLLKNGNVTLALEFAKEEGGRKLTKSIREEVDLIYMEQNENINFSKKQNARLVTFSKAFTIIGTLFLFGIATLVFLIVRPLINQLFESRNREQDNNKLLAEKNEQLEHFAFIASHDLKEPLRSIRGFIGALKEDYGDQLDAEGQQYLSFIEKAGGRMSDLVNGLLTFSRLGRTSAPSKVDLLSVLNGIKKDLDFLIKEKSAEVVVQSLPTIFCMKTEIRQLFQNLINNAIKFSAKDRSPLITIAAKENQNDWEFTVSDNGIGIDEKNKTEIFKMLTKVHHESEYEGQGLGLAFCKKIVEQHKGKIWVESEIGKGSQFIFTVSKTLEQE